MTLPNSSLIICTRNRPQLVLDTIHSVLAGNQTPRELIVIDQSEAPNPQLFALAGDGRCPIRHIATPTVGLGKARNIGIAQAHFPILVFLDDDVYVAPDWLEQIVGALLESGERCVVTGQVLPVTTDARDGFAPSTKIDETPASFVGRPGADLLWGNNMAMFSSVVDAVGLFDERLGTGARFPSSEDNDFGFRLLEAGYVIRYAPEAKVYHRAWRPYRDFWSLEWSYGVGQGGFYAKHLRIARRYILNRMSGDVLRRIRACLAQMVHGQIKSGLGQIVFVAAMLTGFMKWNLTE